MTGPKQGEFWIVEFRGEVTIAKSFRGQSHWQLIGDANVYGADQTFRAICKLNLGALIDREDVQKNRLIWLLIEAAGGKIVISRDVAERLDLIRSKIAWQQNPADGSTTYTSGTKEKL
jgi:hypothetical protein